MKKMITFAYCLLCVMVGFVATSCSESLDITPDGNVETRGTLSYEWSSPYHVGDTVVLICNQILNYSDDKGAHTAKPQAILKLWCKSDSIFFAEGTNPLPLFSKGPMTNGYKDVQPRCYVVNKEIYLNDGQIFGVELRSEIYSYQEYGREYFFDHVKFEDLLFVSSNLRYNNSLVYPDVTFQLLWSVTNGDNPEPKTVQVSYVKKAVKEVDKLLNTVYTKGVDWISETLFCPYVDKTETWQIAGTKTERNISDPLEFRLTSSANRTLDVSNFSFSDEVHPAFDSPVDIGKNGWSVLKRQTT